MRLNSFLRRCRKLGYSDGGMTFEDMCTVTDEQLFSSLINDTNHVLRRLLPPPTTASQHYNLRVDPADTHFSYLNTILGCWTLTSSSECSTNTVTSTQKNSAVFIYRMLLLLLRRVNYIRFFYYLLFISHFDFMYNSAHVSV